MKIMNEKIQITKIQMIKIRQNIHQTNQKTIKQHQTHQMILKKMKYNQNQPNKQPEKQNVKKQQKPSKWKGFLGMIAAAILGSVITLAAVTQLDYFQPDNSNPNVENEQSQSEPVQKDDNSGTQPVST